MCTKSRNTIDVMLNCNPVNELKININYKSYLYAYRTARKTYLVKHSLIITRWYLIEYCDFRLLN